VVEEPENADPGSSDAPDEVEITEPSFLLKAKAPPTARLLSEAIEAAEAAVAELAKDYPKRAGEKVAELDSTFEALPVSENAQAPIRALFAIAHEIRGEGGSFGFPLATAIAANLCRILEDRDQVDEALFGAIRVHIDSLKLVVSQPIKGDGGAQGADLLDGLQKVSSAKGTGAS
jgi:chemotaxis protein histidine kinase CheA